MIKTNELEGDLALGRHANIGGDLRAQGSGHIKLNLRVDGYITANKIKVADKGLFSSSERLLAAYPHPEPGDWALVAIEGSSSEHLGQLYLVNEGKWQAQVDSSGAAVMAGAPTVDSELYEAKLAELQESVEKKVDAVVGKGLSTLDYNYDERQKADRALQEVSFSATADKVFVSTVNNLSQGSSQILSAATPQSAGIMTAADKERLDRCASDDSIGQLASEVVALTSDIANKVDKVQGKQLSTNDYTDLDKAAVEIIATIQETANRAYNTAWSNFNEYYGTINVGNERGDGSMAIIYGATTEKAGLMTAADKRRLDDLRSLTAKMPIRKGTWLRLAEWSGHDLAMAEFTLRLRQLRYAAEIRFAAFRTNVIDEIYLTHRVGNLRFIDKIATATEKSSQRTYLYVHLCESLTAASALPNIDIQAKGIGWNILTPTPISGEVNDETHSGHQEILLHTISPLATPQQDGYLSAADKRKIDSFALSLPNLIQTLNQLAARVEALEN